MNSIGSSSVQSLVSLDLDDRLSDMMDETIDKKLLDCKLIEKSHYKFAEKKKGNDGERCRVRTNYAPVKVQPKTVLYQYGIEINVQDRIRNVGDSKVPQRNRIKQQKKKMIDENYYVIFNRFVDDEMRNKNESIFTSHPIFDGKRIISRTKLRIEDRLTKVVRVKIAERRFLVTFDITITTPKESHLIDLSTLNQIKDQRPDEKTLQALGSIITYAAKRFNLFYNSNMFMKKKDLVDLGEQERREKRFDISSLKEASFGSHQIGDLQTHPILSLRTKSCKLTEYGIQINVDRNAMVFNKSGRLLTIIEEFVRTRRTKRTAVVSQYGKRMAVQQTNQKQQQQQVIRIDDKFKLNENEIRSLNSELKGLSFYVDHLSYKPKNTIFGLTAKSIDETMIAINEAGQAKQISVKEYFEGKYKDYIGQLGRPLFSGLPCVHAGTKQKPIYFPIEVVHIIDDQYCMRKLDRDQQAFLTRKCVEQVPSARFEENRKQLSILVSSSSKCEIDYLKYFGVEIAERFTEVDGRILNIPKICGSNEKEKLVVGGLWKDGHFAIPGKLVNFKWIVINFTKEFNNVIRYAPNKQQIDDLIERVTSAAAADGLRMGKATEVRYDDVYLGKLKLKDSIESLMKLYPDLKLIIYIIPDDDELYAQIKFLSELQFGIITQCINQRKARKFGEKSYAQNVVLKINSKLGGINCHIKSESRLGFLRKKTMIIGLDVTHPSAHDRISSSLASIVATSDNYYVNYYSKSVIQPKPKLEIVDLECITVELLDNFHRKNNCYPLYILVYRDGVSEGQFNEVIDKEINMMKKAFATISKQIEKEYNPKITFIIVQKRHHTRFLPINKKDQDNENVKPGLVVDSGIVSNFFHDFYLNSHKGLRGTSRPTRYIVLHDESGLTGDDIQKTTYYLCHLYPRCMKVVGIPPPILYAHLAAKRARSYLLAMNNRGRIFGERELNPEEIKNLNDKIKVKNELQNTLFFV